MDLRIVPVALVGALLAAVATGCSGGADAEGASEGWRRLPDAPLSARDDAVVVGLDDRVLVVGGWEFSCPPNADCNLPEDPLFTDGALNDVTTDAWSTIAPAPFGLRGGAGAGLDGAAYLVTTCADGPACTALPRLLSYRSADDRWTDHGPLPGPPTDLRSITVVGQSLLVYNGSEGLGEVPDLLFDPVSSTWTELPDDPLTDDDYGRFYVPVGDQLVLTASSTALDQASIERAARFDLTAQKWIALPNPPGQGYQLLPSDRGPLLNGHYSGSSGWILDPGSWTWSALPEHTGEHDDISGVLGRDRAVYDIHTVATMPPLVVYDSVTDEYVTIPPPPGREDVYGDSSTALGRDLVVFGGQRSPGADGDEPEGSAWAWTPPGG